MHEPWSVLVLRVWGLAKKGLTRSSKKRVRGLCMRAPWKLQQVEPVMTSAGGAVATGAVDDGAAESEAAGMAEGAAAAGGDTVSSRDEHHVDQ